MKILIKSSFYHLVKSGPLTKNGDNLFGYRDISLDFISLLAKN